MAMKGLETWTHLHPLLCPRDFFPCEYDGQQLKLPRLALAPELVGNTHPSAGVTGMGTTSRVETHSHEVPRYRVQQVFQNLHMANGDHSVGLWILLE